jgi:electron transfer flavoprotein beta subunit
VESILNPLDEFAVEEAVRLVDRFGGEAVVFSMGPPQCEKALRRAISFGIQKAVQVTDRAFAGADTWATSLTLAAAIRKIGPFDIILCGKQAIDGDTAQVGPELAAHLSIPQITYVRKILELRDKKLVVERLVEDGVEKIEVQLPAVLTVLKEINEPRLPDLAHWLWARKEKITLTDVSNLGVQKEEVGLSGSPTTVNRITTPPRRPAGKRLEGKPEEISADLIKILSNRGLLRLKQNDSVK